MRVLDAGHLYELASLDGGDVRILRFVKRMGPKYPGNDWAYGGTTSQEVLRALIDRARYLNAQIPCAETEAIIGNLQTALLLFEIRAARVHGRPLDLPSLRDFERLVPCAHCLHVECKEFVGVAP